MDTQTVAQEPARPPADAPSAREPGTGPVRRLVLAWPLASAAVACVMLAAVSAAVLPTVPSYDPWAWIVWGREVVDPHLSFATGGGPSWKPLPVMFTTVFGLFGGAAPTLWVITARAGGLLALVGAYRLGARLAGGTRAAAVGAGVIAAAALLLTQDWFYYLFRGTSEPMLVAAALLAVDRHLEGHRGQAFAFGIAASLIRPEAWPFVLAYAIWLWFKDSRMRILVVVGLLMIPFFWFVPPWIGSGQPFLAASHAKQYNGHLGKHRFLEVLRRGVDLQLLPVFLLGLVAVALALFTRPARARDRLTMALAACAAGWWVLVVALTLDGYPGLERFYLPAAGITCVLAGVAVVRVAELAGRASEGFGRAALARAVPLAVAVALIGLSVPFATGRINTARAQEPVARRAVKRLDQLSAAVRAVGGRWAVFPCRSSFAAVNHGVQTALAWKLHVTLGRVGTTMRHQGVMFVGPHDTIDGQPPPIRRRLTQVRLLARVGAWRVYRVTAPGASTRCVGR